jgi:uncharacterized protein (TIGR02147 family)
MAVQYQDFLLEEFRSRRGRNPQYSLRAFARDLGMPASKLSQNLRGLCGISVAKAETLAGRLQMADEQKSLFLALVESQHARSRVARAQAEALLTRIRENRLDVINLEQFSAVRDWYHFAILELTTVRGFRSDVHWIADKLGLEVNLVENAVRRLENLGLMARAENGPWTKVSSNLEYAGGVPAPTVREHHRQMIAKAQAALETLPIESREFSTLTFAIDRARLPELKALVREFQHRVNRIANQGEADAVYAMSTQLFPLAVVEEPLVGEAHG